MEEADQFVKGVGGELFVCPDGNQYLSYRHPTLGGRTAVEVGGAEFRKLVTRQFILQNRAIGKGEADVIADVLGAKMWQEKPTTRAVHTRVAFEGGDLYLDLADSAGRVVKVTKDGWKVGQDYPVAFLRPEGVRPLPEPVPGGTLDDLTAVFPPSLSAEQRVAVVGWLLAAFHPGVASHALYLRGAAGSGKSVLIRRLRALLDPSKTPLGGAPDTADDAKIAASNSWLVVWDNLSKLTPKESDAICRMLTGDSLRKRKLHSDTGEVMREFRRPAVLAGIGEFITKSDLLDRSIPVDVTRIPNADRRTESEMEQRFAADTPRLLGAVLDALAAGLRTPAADAMGAAVSSRMADAAVWAERCFRGVGFKPGAFADAAGSLRASAAGDPLEAWVVWPHLEELLKRKGTLTTTASQLLLSLNTAAGDSPARFDGDWPRSASVLSGRLADVKDELKRRNVSVVFSRSNGKRIVTLQLFDPQPAAVEAGAATVEPPTPLTASDAGDTTAATAA